ncbi:autophagy-related protein 16 [Lophiotrema nucula]|uniref:Autophagy-related protein 16 n=1 Tax=Lophiotrema nucula TaxID=690887 RepID=A0A6A5ZVR4_9PLEO|nr:autophagy-related protein 16 [Lophiotrema nucula]
MSNPLAEYLSALEARDAKEKAHKSYVDAYTTLADRTAAALSQEPGPPVKELAPPPTPSPAKTPKGKAPHAPQDALPSNVKELRSELAATQKIRADLESQLSDQSEELKAAKTQDTIQKKRIAQLERVKDTQDRKLRDKAEELQGKGGLVGSIQDEMVVLTLELNMSEQRNAKLKLENEELTRRWVDKMEEEVTRMNELNDRSLSGASSKGRRKR